MATTAKEITIESNGIEVSCIIDSRPEERSENQRQTLIALNNDVLNIIK